MLDGIYMARPSQEDKDLAFLILQFGGPSLLDICHKANTLPSVSTAYRMSKQLLDIDCNIGKTPAQCLQRTTLITKDNSTFSFSMKADETFVTPRLRYDGKYDQVQGLCYEHGSSYTKFQTYDGAKTLADAVTCGNIHVPKECLIISGCSLNEASSSEIVLAWPKCQKSDFDQSFHTFEALCNEYYNLSGKPLMNFSTDGDSTRRQVFNQLLHHELDPLSPLGEVIFGRQLVDTNCGKQQETVSYDPKHLCKRCWTSFTKESVCVSGVTIKKTDLQILFSLLPETNELEIDGLLYPNDKQNVPSATRFLLTFIDAVKNVPAKDFPYRLISIWKDLLVLADMMIC